MKIENLYIKIIKENRTPVFLLVSFLLLNMAGCLKPPAPSPKDMVDVSPQKEDAQEIPVPVYHEIEDKQKLTLENIAKTMVVIWSASRWDNSLKTAEFFQKRPHFRANVVLPDSFFDDSVDSRKAKQIFRNLVSKKQLNVILSLPGNPLLPLLMDTNLAEISSKTVQSLPARYSWPDDVTGQISVAQRYFERRWKKLSTTLWVSAGIYFEDEKPFLRERKIKSIALSDRYGKAGYYQDDFLKIVRPASFTRGNLEKKQAWFRKWKKGILGNKGLNPAIFISSLGDLEKFEEVLAKEDGVSYEWSHLSEILSLRKLSFPAWPPPNERDPNFALWMGENEENTAWYLLGLTRNALEEYKNSDNVQERRLDLATRELYNAQSSRFFYYFGADRDSGRDTDLKREFLSTLNRVFRLMGRLALPELKKGFSVSMSDSLGARGTKFEKHGNTLVWSDPLKDDRGPGEYFYPIGAEFLPGSWDLGRFSVSKNSRGIIFRLQIANLSNPWEGSFGFSLPVMDVYIDINHLVGAGSNNLLTGRPGMVEAQNAWEYALSVDGWGARLYGNNGRKQKILVDNLSVRKVTDDTIEILVPKEYIRGVPDGWGFAVLVMARMPSHIMTTSSQDAKLSFPMKVGKESTPYQFGGAWQSENEGNKEAPPFIDILTPPGMEQERILGVYKKGLDVVIPFVRGS